MTQKYTVRRYNPIAKLWSVYHQTFCMVDAYAIHDDLINRGEKASIESSRVDG